jgi:hypothetical protein
MRSRGCPRTWYARNRQPASYQGEFFLFLFLLSAKRHGSAPWLGLLSQPRKHHMGRGPGRAIYLSGLNYIHFTQCNAACTWLDPGAGIYYTPYTARTFRPVSSRPAYPYFALAAYGLWPLSFVVDAAAELQLTSATLGGEPVLARCSASSSSITAAFIARPATSHQPVTACAKAQAAGPKR